jgi:hypothetical protein
MTAQNVLVLMITTFLVVALLLIYNGFYDPISESGIGVPSTVEAK